MKKPLAFHPFLFALAPILFLYAHNVARLPISSSELLPPVLIALGFALIAWAVLAALLRSSRKAGIIVSTFLVLFFLYGHAAGALGPNLGRAALLVPVSLLVLCIVAVAVIRSQSGFTGLTAFLNVVSLILVLINLVSGLPALLRSPRASRPHTSSPAGAAGKPDIYYIILDGYAREDVLESVYRLDNSDFIEYLRSKGFEVASRSRSNYSQTYLSLASSLNMTYLDSLARKLGPDSDNRSPLGRMIENNHVMAELRRRGYTTVSFASGYTGTDFDNADVHFAPRWALSEFQNVLISTTALPVFLKLLGRQSQYDLHRQRILYAFERLPDAAGLKPPVFVFCHILAPHPPFVFGPNGEKVDPKGFFTLTEGGTFRTVDKEKVRKDYIENYRNQLAFIAMKARQTIDRILARSTAPPVIILQADHGPGSILNWDEPEPDQIAERMAILNAYLLPSGSPGPAWYDSISPVNTFRLVLDRVFGDSLPLLPDKSWFSTITRPYRFFDVDKPETYAAAHDTTLHPLSIVAFRIAETPAPDDPGLYARRLVNLKYPKETRPIANIYIRYVRAKPEGFAVEGAFQAYRDAVKYGEIPDLGDKYDSYTGPGPGREPVTALFFTASAPRDSTR